MSQPLPAFRVGLGYDIHPLVAGRPCILGGVNIPSPVGPEGHSDADVLLHAVADAILGAAGLRDIGHYFPNTDASLKGLDSAVIVKKAVAEAKGQGGWVVGNVDIVIIGERPKVMAHVDAMKAKVAEIIGISASQVGIKATTNEGMDSIGQGKALAVQAICLISKGF
ncbi:MAG: 2-C-methyl-D-erythritol 2,4-cyclodiphosphate synthase [Opitutales bacterium]|jgi:2-C-methyl-D-erythritol 2,4-cyclodiphosphate synthase|nr:2-C-methyl-D-erythritol 2,4-cyclodiphosphate synthase [Opitutales bacterium]MDP4659426.1 2-C-methyl-D-erythritol 2,4-cyclodiphosphate synthase [Opitutales bacterium]MDP4774946.1 2-C-methyl-D-erythritol 2,4-cyclodiphosphate synthase [Opitutales bacterium]MDP4787915.1 2-C-methyl-D-erythritol 2,4-cyclodiphosphate synthase [Opitutales bacterium]MDP4861559.1 2-C-methyl-D-erythritol 2,4-cyclodiphosphate synthase [Opitutales bacterium]